jgi:hypothetical protein
MASISGGRGRAIGLPGIDESPGAGKGPLADGRAIMIEEKVLEVFSDYV